jgi:probable HAF family extracellular repeat protein
MRSNDARFVVAVAFFGIATSSAYSTPVGFISSGGSLTTLNIAGATRTEAYGINNAGQVVGDYSTNNGATYGGFLYNSGSFTTFNVPGSIGTIPLDINSTGQIVGYSIAA